MQAEDLLAQALKDGTYFSNPHPLFAQLRKILPVFYSDSLAGWVLLKYEDVDSVLRRAETFSSAGRVIYLINQLPPEIRAQLHLLESHFATGLAHTDAPEHKRLRGLLARAFTPKMIENSRDYVNFVVRDRVSTLPREFDLIEDLLVPIPALVVGKMLGSSETDIPDLIRWAGAINGLYERGGRIDPEKALYAEKMLEEIREFVLRLVAQRRANPDLDPNSDVLAGLVLAEADGDSLTESELVSTVVTLFVAGHETTTHLLGNGFLALLSNGSLWNSIQGKPEVIAGVVDEMARFDGSVPRSWRIAREDVVINEVSIPAGSLVLPMLTSANRDPEVFEDPDRFDIYRDSRRHIAFGKGVHVCLGAPLARVEGQEILKVLLELKPNLALARSPSELLWRKDIALRGLISLPVTS
ncbi:MAG: cytochrome P450 [Actinobacteria bacterium]|nr:cytochrome P450 [Actinomycetota bacterium]